MALQFSQNTKGILSLIGTCLFCLVMGSTYIWGNISIYVSSYYKNVSEDEGSIVFPVANLVSNVGVVCSFPSLKYLGFRPTLILGALLMFGFVLGSSFCPSFWSFFFCFAVGYGGSSGLTFLALIYNTYKYFPTKRGLVGGIGLCFYGFASLISNYILLSMVNPDDVQAIKNPATDDYLFPDEIADRLPSGLRYLAFYFLGVTIIGTIFQFEFKDPIVTEALEENPEKKNDDVVMNIEENANVTNNNNTKPESSKDNLIKYCKISDGEEDELSHKIKSINNSEDQNDVTGLSATQKALLPKTQRKKENNTKWSVSSMDSNDERRCFSIKDAYSTRAVYLITIMMFFATTNGYFMVTNFKNYGIMKISDDNFLTLIGSLGSVFGGLGRLGWGLLSDRYDFKKTYLVVLIIQIINIATLRFISDYQVLYLVWICFAFLCEGGNFVLFPPLCLKVFGPNVGSKIYSILLIVCAGANLTQFGVNLGLRSVIGYDNEFFLFLGFILVPFIICLATDIKFRR